MRTDADLVKAVIGGQKHAFAVLVERYERPVKAAVISILRDHSIAQDAAQEAFVKAYENLAGLRKAGAFGPWVIKIASRCALSMAQRMPATAALGEAETLTSAGSDGRLDQDKRRLLDTVMKLPESERQAVMLRYFSDHSVNEVAQLLGRSVGTVTKQLSRAHKRLRTMLERSEI